MNIMERNNGLDMVHLLGEKFHRLKPEKLLTQRVCKHGINRAIKAASGYCEGALLRGKTARLNRDVLGVT